MMPRFAGMVAFACVLACGHEPEPVQLNVQLEAQTAQAPFLGKLAVAWFQGHELAIDSASARAPKDGAARLELTESPTSFRYYDEWDANGVGLRVGIPVAIDDVGDDLVKLFPEEPVESSLSTDAGSQKIEAWCAEGAELCVHFGCEDVEELCFRNFYECTGTFVEECKLTRSEGQPHYMNPWGALAGLAEDYLVLEAEHAIPADQLAAIGLYVGDLEPGHHVIRGRALKGAELEASRKCWSRAASLAEAYIAGERIDELDIQELESRHVEVARSLGFEWWPNVLMFATLGLECPVHHVRYELADAREARIDVRLSRLTKPLFRFVRPVDDVALYQEVTQ